MLQRSSFKKPEYKEYIAKLASKRAKIAPKTRVKKKAKTYKQRKAEKQKTRWGVKLWSIKKADLEMSRWVREQKNYTCEVCGYRAEPPTKEIQCSHYIGRSEYATRYLPENLDCLCATCHNLFEDRKQYEYRDFKIKKHGVEGELELRYKKNTYKGVSESIYECMKLLGKAE